MSIPLSGYPEYVPLTNHELRIKLVELKQFIDCYASVVGISINDILINTDNIIEIIERVDKRKVYFRIFYGKDISERNEAALYCFWILKLSPFFNSKTPSHRINVSFATFLFLRMVTYTCKKANKSVGLSRQYLLDLVYSFTFRDISKESIMSIAETFLI